MNNEWKKEFGSKFNIAYVKDKGFARLSVEIQAFISQLLKDRDQQLIEAIEGMKKVASVKNNILFTEAEDFNLACNEIIKTIQNHD